MILKELKNLYRPILIKGIISNYYKTEDRNVKADLIAEYYYNKMMLNLDFLSSDPDYDKEKDRNFLKFKGCHKALYVMNRKDIIDRINPEDVKHFPYNKLFKKRVHCFLTES